MWGEKKSRPFCCAFRFLYPKLKGGGTIEGLVAPLPEDLLLAEASQVGVGLREVATAEESAVG